MPTGSGGASGPSEADISRLKAAAAAAAREVAGITAEVERADARLQTLQRAVAEAVAGDEEAQRRLVDAETALGEAKRSLAAAQGLREDADGALAAGAALMYMQGGDLQNLATLLLTPPGVMSDLVLVLDSQAGRAREDLDAATAAVRKAATTQRLLGSARQRRAVAVTQAGAKRRAAETEAARAGTEAARLGKRQEALTARLATLDSGAADLVAQREAAARLLPADLLGVQAVGAPGSGPRAAQLLAHAALPAYGWDEAEFTCLVQLWNGESGWSWSATNRSSGAFGIPQALPGWKMSSAGSDWLTNPATQIRWGMDYIASSYGSPCGALDQWLARSPHWY